ncbi:MAG TPA: GspMb/PilO family protein [Gallionella sp.]
MKRLANELLGLAADRCAQLCGSPSAAALPDCLRWVSRRWLRALGWPGVTAIGLLAVLPPFYFSAIVPAQERLDAARRSTLSLREQITHAGKSLAGVRRTPDRQLAEFYRLIPDEHAAPQWLKKLVALAGKNGLALNEGEYRAMRDRQGRLMRLQIVLPVKGEYRQIRRFLAMLPAEIPVIALENVQFSRPNVADPAVEARIRLALYLEQES